MQGDEPLLPAQLVQQVAQLLEAQPECSMSTLCEPIQQLDEFTRDSIVKVVMSKHNQALYFSRATIPYDRDGAKEATPQLHEHAYRHLGLYAYRVELLQEYVTWEMGTLEKLRKLRAIACLRKWTPYCYCCCRSQFTPRCRHPSRLRPFKCNGYCPF